MKPEKMGGFCGRFKGVTELLGDHRGENCFGARQRILI